MTSPTPEAADRVVARLMRLAARYPGVTLTAENYAAYSETLSQLAPEDLDRAIDYLSKHRAEFFPTCGTIYQTAEELRPPERYVPPPPLTAEEEAERQRGLAAIKARFEQRALERGAPDDYDPEVGNFEETARRKLEVFQQLRTMMEDPVEIANADRAIAKVKAEIAERWG